MSTDPTAPEVLARKIDYLLANLHRSPAQPEAVYAAIIEEIPNLTRAVIDLTATIKRMEALADRLDNDALWALNHPDMDDDLKAHAHADRGIADQIRAALNGDNK